MTVPAGAGSLTGLASMQRFLIRRDRVRIAVWIASIVLLVAVTAASVKGLYPTQESLDLAAAASQDNAAVIAFNGPAQGLDTVGGQVAFQVGALGLVAVALMSVLVVGRATRGEEEAGRLELLRSLPVGAAAPTLAAAIVGLGMNVTVGLLVASCLLAMGLPATGSVVFGLSFTLLGALFVAVVLVTAQLSESARLANGLAGSILGAAFVLRAVGDVGGGALSWASPIGWAQKTRPYAGERWWPLLVLVAATGALGLLAARLAARRDVGAGLLRPRPGPRRAAPSLGRPFGLAVRLQRGTVLGWSVGVVLIGAAYGSIADSIDDFVRDNPALADVLARAGGGSLIDAYLGTSLRVLALIVGGFAVQATLRLRSEEAQERAEPVLATPTSRQRWTWSHVGVAALGSIALLIAAGLALGLTYAATGGEARVIGRVVVAALAYTPAVWVLVAVAVMLFGFAPGAVAAVWGLVAGCFVVALLGQLLDLPQWASNLSPFDQVPLLPAADFTVLPLAVLVAVAAAVGWSGFTAFRNRDVG